MAYFKGNGPYSVNFESINEYNKILFSLIHCFAEMACEGNGADVIKGAVEEVDGCIKFHLRKEERFLESLDYPFIDVHKDRHHLFLDQITILKDLCRFGQLQLVHNILLSLQFSLIHHMSNFENEYFMFSTSGNVNACQKQLEIGNS